MIHFDAKSMWGFRLQRDPTFQGDYMAGMGVCEDPSCPCAVVTLGCKESNPAPDASMGIPYIFQIDLDTRKVVKSFSKEGRTESDKFGQSYVRELGGKEWAHLRNVFLSAKRALTENLNPEKVKYQFNIRQIENEAAMVSYISVLCFDEGLDFTSDSREFFVNDYYCLKSDCTCKSVHLVFHEKPANTGSKAPILGSLTYSYDSQTDSFDENSIGSRERVGALFSSLKSTRPDLASVIRKRHGILKMLYGNLLRDNRPPSSPSKVGRNDPCPCGSGRKFKHCCGR
ncbi:MAG: SEC-C metal-binding domain-containing protein [Spirochaetes bacterium]|nr:SEC-C metal-binding domain-containing protein [Spirochaetota bacterium]